MASSRVRAAKSLPTVLLNRHVFSIANPNKKIELVNTQLGLVCINKSSSFARTPLDIIEEAATL